MIPFFEKYPYTNFEQLNLDYLLSEVSAYSRRITDCENGIRSLDTRVTKNEEDISDLSGRMTTAEGDINGLKGRMTDAESDINGLKGRMTDAEGDISSLKGRMTTAEGDISNLKGRMTDAEGNITGLGTAVSAISDDLTATKNTVQGHTNAINALDLRVDDLEDHSVIANPGGTGAQLNTLSVDGVTYEVTGGGGSGSSITPNPSGPATVDLEKVDIDGIIYGIPGEDTSSLIAEPYDGTATYTEGDYCIYNDALCKYVSGNWVPTNCTDEIKGSESEVNTLTQLFNTLGQGDTLTGSAHGTSSTSAPKEEIIVPGSVPTLTPGVWVLTLNVTFDTSTLGNKQRTLNIYLDDTDGVTKYQTSKYMWGSEAITSVLSENSVSLTAVHTVDAGTTDKLIPKVRVPVNTGSGSYDAEATFGYVCIKPFA